MGEETRDAVEAWEDGAAAFIDGESPYCLAYRLCRASFAGFDSGRALLAGGVRGWEEVVGRARGGLMGIHGHPPLCMLRYVDAQRRGGS